MTRKDRLILASHELKIALLQPQIAPNTGNIARLCVATGSELHLVRPLGFVLSDRELKRSAGGETGDSKPRAVSYRKGKRRRLLKG